MSQDRSKAGSRKCGCAWYWHARSGVTFTHRCDTHAPMCRSMEPWELELLHAADRKDNRRGRQ